MARTIFQPVGKWFPASDAVLTISPAFCYKGNPDEGYAVDENVPVWLFAMPVPYGYIYAGGEDGEIEAFREDEIEVMNETQMTGEGYIGRGACVRVGDGSITSMQIVCDIPDNYALFFSTNEDGYVDEELANTKVPLSWSKR